MCHVLIIEDEFLTAHYLQDLVESLGATSCDIADSEADAIASALRHKPAIITSDVNLRIGKGPDAVAAIVEHMGPVPTIFVTATPSQCNNCLPPNELIAKPVNEAHFKQSFFRLLAASS